MATVGDFIMDAISPKNSVDAGSHDRTSIQEELERRLRCRVDREELVKKNILPDLATSPKLFTQTQQLQRAKIADNLQKRLRNRADRNDLMQMNILPDLHTNIDPALQAKQLQLRKHKLADTLSEKLALRPGPLELIRGGILELPDLAAVVDNVPFDKTSHVALATGKLRERPTIPEIALHVSGSRGAAAATSCLSTATIVPGRTQQRMDAVMSPPLASPASSSEAGYNHTSLNRKYSDSSLSPAASPGEADEGVRSPVKSPQSIPSPRFTQSYPPPMRATQTAGIMSAGSIGKAPSPSQTRKKQQKQQKYRKLRYHEYVPPSKTNSKGGKTTPKPAPKSDSPYSLLLQQQQLFLQLQVLQHQYPNGVLMQKLPDLINNLSKDKPGGGKARSSVTSPPVSESSGGASRNGGTVPNIPQVLQVEQPNRYNTSTVRFDELKVNDLKAACKELGMIVSGKKAELAERLLERNKGVLPASALPDGQNKDGGRRQVYSSSHASSVDSQVSAPSTVSPTTPSLSPIFKFPSKTHGSVPGGQQSQKGVAKGAAGGASVGGGTGERPDLPTGMEVFPAADLQQQFDEMVERQKRTYISHKAPKSLAPRPQLNDMLAISFPCPMDQQTQTQHHYQGTRGAKGSTLPHRSESGPYLQFTDKQSRSLPSSPKPLSPGENILMDDSPAPQLKQELRGDCGALGIGMPPPPVHTQLQRQQQQQQQQTVVSSEASFLHRNAIHMTAALTSSGLRLPTTSSMTSATEGLGPTPSYYQHHNSMRPSRSSLPLQPPKVHPINPPSYSVSTSGGALMQRSMSLSAAVPSMPPHSLPRIHSATAFTSDLDMVTTSSDLSKPMTPENLLMGPEDGFMEMPMDATEYKDQHLSEIFDILRADGGSEFATPGQPPSLGLHYNKYGTRQDSVQSDSIMLGGGGLHFGNPPLGPQHKSGSDLCLTPSREGQKNSGAGNVPYGAGMLGSNELGWLDLDSSGTLSLSPTMNSYNTGCGSLTHSNPGSLPHEQFHLSFLDDKPMNHAMNGLGSSHGGGDMHSFLDPGFTHHHDFLPSDDATALLELGLTSSV